MSQIELGTRVRIREYESAAPVGTIVTVIGYANEGETLVYEWNGHPGWYASPECVEVVED